MTSFLSLVFFLSIVAIIISAIILVRSRKDKESKEHKQSKLWTIIFAIVLVVSFVGYGVSSNHDEEVAQAQQYKKDKKNYRKQRDRFVTLYGDIGSVVEDLSTKEGDEWEDAIDNSGDDFDVDSTIDDIEENHSDDIDTVSSSVDKLHSLDQKIQDNSAAPKKEKNTIHKAYLDLKHFGDHATDIYGSYNDFTDKHNSMDQKVADRYEELQDL